MHCAGDAGVKLAGAFIGAIGAERRSRALLADRRDAAVTIDSGCRGENDRDFSAASQSACLIEDVDRAGEVHLMRAQPLAVGAHNGCDCCQMKAALDALERLLDSPRASDVP